MNHTTAVTIPGAVQWDITSRNENRDYRIFVALPAASPPPAGFPVIYVLDAMSVFGTLTEAMRVQSRRSEKTGVVPTAIVGIGYRSEAPFDEGRYYDYTLPLHSEEMPVRPNGEPWPESGGADSFAQFIGEELMPIIQREYPVDPARQTLFGHSLGGHFVLHTLFTKPAMFRAYVAGSPSIHWNKRLLEEEERAFAAWLRERPTALSLLIGVGGLERSPGNRMADHAQELAQRLSALEGAGLHAEYREFESENHVSVIPLLAIRALRCAAN